MMTEESYFFDSYAFIEIALGNENYKKYIGCRAIITKLNLFEVYQSLLTKLSVEVANTFIRKEYNSTVDYNKEIIIKAVLLKILYAKRKLSMTDCIGYILAREYSVKFLTGDKEFEYLDNVEFVK